MIDKKYRFTIFEDFATADFVFDAFGETLSDLFVACAEACFFAMTDIDKVSPRHELDIELGEENRDELLVAFISELIYLKDVEKMFFSKFNVDVSPDGRTLCAVAGGEHIDYNKHVIKTDVKAITHHDLRIKEENKVFATRVILDL